MEFSQSMIFVLARADAELAYAGIKEKKPECLLLGILKLSELRAEEFLVSGVSEEVIQATNSDIDEVKEMLREKKIDSSLIRSLLRLEIRINHTTNNALYIQYLEEALRCSSERGSHIVFARDMLRVIFEIPTDVMTDVCPMLKKNKNTDVKETSSSHESDIGLSELTNGIRHMRAELLNIIKGQDHVIHSFVEGMFAAGVLPENKDRINKPKAVFVFTGPPGVGKTFLAEQAANSLNLPFMRFDMSSYSDSSTSGNLVGISKWYQGAKTGLLTDFVKNNPNSVLLFDEIEKAHINIIHLFLQVLDEGVLKDQYSDENISFSGTVIIFTSNACKSLYEGKKNQYPSCIPQKTIVNALQTEKNAYTGQLYFPAPITSRLIAGNVLMFNHLKASDLIGICARELEKLCESFKKKYGIEVNFSPLLPSILLFRAGGQVDARTIKAQASFFFKNELFRICRLWGEDSFKSAIGKIKSINYLVDKNEIKNEVYPLFYPDAEQGILIFGDSDFADSCNEFFPDIKFYSALTSEEALKIIAENNILFSMMAITPDNTDNDLNVNSSGFDFTSISNGKLRQICVTFRKIREEFPSLPIYILDSDAYPLDPELELSFIREGAGGKLQKPIDDFSVFEDMLEKLIKDLHMQIMAARMASERKVISFDSAPYLDSACSEVTVFVKDFSLRRAPDADDVEDILDNISKPDTKFDDIIGASEAKDELKFYIEYLKNPKKFTIRGVLPPKGILLYGPSGTGKTMLAKALAGESDVAFIPAVASEFVTKWQGSGPEAVRKLFNKARRYAPAVIFIDEIDAIGRKRGESNTAHGEEMALNALLAEMDGFNIDSSKPVFVLAATNYDVDETESAPGTIDSALSRRFDRKIKVELPNKDERLELLQKLLNKVSGKDISDEMIAHIAERSLGMSPAVLTGMVNLAIRNSVKAEKLLDDTELDEAFEVTRHGTKKDRDYEYLKRVAYHECGHAFMCWNSGKTPAYLTIVSRGDHGGYVEQSTSENMPIYTKTDLINRIRICLGGRAAETMFYGKENGISTGASSDLRLATDTALSIVCSYGMDDEFGLCVTSPAKGLEDSVIRKRVNEILNSEFSFVLRTLEENRESVERLAAEVMSSNKLKGEEIEKILSSGNN